MCFKVQMQVNLLVRGVRMAGQVQSQRRGNEVKVFASKPFEVRLVAGGMLAGYKWTAESKVMYNVQFQVDEASRYLQ